MAKERIKVLIVEDDELISGMYNDKLQMEGFDTITALDGAAGLSAAMTEKPDIILLDVIMPELDGFEVLRRLRSDSKTASLPVIMLTNLNQAEQIEKGQSLGATDYLVKAEQVPQQVVNKIYNVLNTSVVKDGQKS